MTQLTLQDIRLDDAPYFEVQGTQSAHSGMHALNNLLGQFSVREVDLEKICQEMEQKSEQPVTKSQTCCSKGDYTAKVLTAALAKLGFEAFFFDPASRLTAESLQEMSTNKQSVGFLMSIRKHQSCLKSLLSKLLCHNPTHWCCIRKFHSSFVLLDSIFDQPLYFDSPRQVVSFLQVQFHNGAEVAVVNKCLK